MVVPIKYTLIFAMRLIINITNQTEPMYTQLWRIICNVMLKDFSQNFINNKDNFKREDMQFMHKNWNFTLWLVEFVVFMAICSISEILLVQNYPKVNRTSISFFEDTKGGSESVKQVVAISQICHCFLYKNNMTHVLKNILKHLSWM